MPQPASSLPLSSCWGGYVLTIVPYAPLAMRLLHNESSRTWTPCPFSALASASVNHIAPPSSTALRVGIKRNTTGRTCGMPPHDCAYRSLLVSPRPHSPADLGRES